MNGYKINTKLDIVTPLNGLEVRSILRAADLLVDVEAHLSDCYLMIVDITDILKLCVSVIDSKLNVLHNKLIEIERVVTKGGMVHRGYETNIYPGLDISNLPEK